MAEGNTSKGWRVYVRASRGHLYTPEMAMD